MGEEMSKLFLGFLIGIILSFGLMWLFIFQFITLTTIQPNVIEAPEDKIMNQVEKIAKNVSSSQEYKKNKYDCTEFS